MSYVVLQAFAITTLLDLPSKHQFQSDLVAMLRARLITVSAIEDKNQRQDDPIQCQPARELSADPTGSALSQVARREATVLPESK